MEIDGSTTLTVAFRFQEPRRSGVEGYGGAQVS